MLMTNEQDIIILLLSFQNIRPYNIYNTSVWRIGMRQQQCGIQIFFFFFNTDDCILIIRSITYF